MSINVLIVDDSATIRALLTEILSSEPSINHIDTAPDPFIARNKIIKQKPDVICLDVEMPKMDGITFLKKMMQHLPIPIVMVSSLTHAGAQTTLDALEAGAVDFIAKPKQHLFEHSNPKENDELKAFSHELISKVKSAARSSLDLNHSEPITETKSNIKNTSRLDSKPTRLKTSKQFEIVAIGASTGGTEAIRQLLMGLDADSPAMMITQHMPEHFTSTFAQRLNDLCELTVKEAENGDKIKPGYVYIAPGNMHMVLRKKMISNKTEYFIETGGGQKVSGHKPSIDVMFNSIAKNVTGKVLGIILTGMGRDGAKGLLAMKNAGAYTLGQTKNSCVVYGMPKVAFELGAVDKQVNLNAMSRKITDFFNY